MVCLPFALMPLMGACQARALREALAGLSGKWLALQLDVSEKQASRYLTTGCVPEDRLALLPVEIRVRYHLSRLRQTDPEQGELVTRLTALLELFRPMPVRASLTPDVPACDGAERQRCA